MDKIYYSTFTSFHFCSQNSSKLQRNFCPILLTRSAKNVDFGELLANTQKENWELFSWLVKKSVNLLNITSIVTTMKHLLTFV